MKGMKSEEATSKEVRAMRNETGLGSFGNQSKKERGVPKDAS